MALQLTDKVTIQVWLSFKPYTTFTSYDTDFLKVANAVYDRLLEEQYFSRVEMERFELIELACALTSYFEDFTSEIGLWQVFTAHNQTYLNRPLPFYDLTGYDPDYLNWQDIAYQIWHYIGKHYAEVTVSPDLPLILEMASDLFDLFEERLEDMYSTDFYEEFFRIPDEGVNFFEMKEKLKWMGLSSYLIGLDGKRKHSEQLAEVMEKYPGLLASGEAGKFIYALEDDLAFGTRSSFGGLIAPEWFARLAVCSDQKRQEIEALQYRHTGDYFLDDVEGKEYFLFRHLHTQQTYRVRQDSLQKGVMKKSDMYPGEHALYTLTLAQWNGDWWVSGIMIKNEVTEAEREARRRKPFAKAWMYSEEQLASARENIKRMGEAFQEYFGGSLAFFENEQKLNEANQAFMDYFIAKSGQAEQAQEKRQTYQEQQGGPLVENLKELIGSDEDLGLLFAKGQGTVILSGIRKTIQRLEAEELPKEEATDLFLSLAHGYPPVAAEYLITHYPTRNIRYPVAQSGIDGLASLPYWWRFYEPGEFGKQFPLVTLVDLD